MERKPKKGIVPPAKGFEQPGTEVPKPKPETKEDKMSKPPDTKGMSDEKAMVKVNKWFYDNVGVKSVARYGYEKSGDERMMMESVAKQYADMFNRHPELRKRMVNITDRQKLSTLRLDNRELIEGAYGWYNYGKKSIALGADNGTSLKTGTLRIGKNGFKVEEENRSFTGTTRHEFGHYYHMRVLDDYYGNDKTGVNSSWGSAWRKVRDDNGNPVVPDSKNYASVKFWGSKVSKYGGYNEKELFAESFRAYTHPDYGKGGDETRLPKPIEEFMNKYVGRD